METENRFLIAFWWHFPLKLKKKFIVYQKNIRQFIQILYSNSMQCPAIDFAFLRTYDYGLTLVYCVFQCCV